MACTIDSLLGPSKMVIKPYQSDFVAIKGSLTVEKMGLSSLEIPYWQVLRSKIDLGPAESYSLVGIGDNHNFLMIRVFYDQRSSEPDQFLQMYRSNVLYGVMGQLYIETSNTSNRQNTITLKNTSTQWSCQVEFFVSSIDNQKNYFGSIPDPTETTGVNYFNDIKSMTPTQIGIYTNNVLVAFVVINEIANYFIDSNNDKNLIIDDISKGVITISFIDNWNAKQAFSALAWLLYSPDIRTLPQLADTTSPVITFTNNVTYVSGQGYFMTLSLSTSGSVSGLITISDLILLAITNINDARDGIIQVENYMLSLTDGLITVGNINSTGMYILNISVNDVAGNNTSINMKITVNP